MRPTVMLVGLGMLAGQALAVDRHVPAVYPTIQSAINASSDGDAVLIQSGIYPENVNTLGRDITIAGAPGSSVAITGSGAFAPVLTISAGGSPEIANLIIRDGSAQRGGGILVQQDANAIIRDCEVVNNDAFSGGGGVYLELDTAVTLERCEIRANHSQGEGGGVYTLDGSSLRIIDTLFEANTATLSGGGLRAYDTGVEISGSSRFLDNVSERAGGAIIAINGALLEMDSARFTGNQAGWYGGAVTLSAAGMTTTFCEFESNAATDPGGAVYMLGGSEAFSRFDQYTGNSAAYAGGVGVQNSSYSANTVLFRDNVSLENGGGLYVSGLSGNASATVYNAVFEGNTAVRGAGVYVVAGAVELGITRVLLANCQIVNNTGTGVGALGGIAAYQSSLPDPLTEIAVINSTIARNSGGVNNGFYAGADAPVSIANTIVWDNAGASLSGSWAGRPIQNSIFPEAGTLGDVGSFSTDPLFRDAPMGDFSLRSASPAIDAGDSALVPADTLDDDADSDFFEPLPLDLAGYARFVNDPLTPDTGVDAGLGVVDIGAHEFRRTCAADFAEPITVINFDDVLAFLSAFGAMQPIADLAPAFGAFDFDDVLAFLLAFGSGCP